MRKLMILLATILLVGIAGCRNSGGEYTVMKGPFRQSFTETGDLDAISSIAIMVPQIRWEYGYQYKIIAITEAGKIVNEGDTVVRLDPSAIQKIIIAKEEALENERAASKKLQVQMDNNIQELKAKLKTEEATYDLRKLELERSKFDAEKNRKIKELQFRQSTIQMEKVKRQLERKPVMDGYDYKIQKIKEKQVEADLNGALEAVNKLMIRSPESGMFQPGDNRNYWPPRSLKLGDQVWMGSMVAKIPDINHMKVRTFVHETDFTKISLGMNVLVRLDALPELAFKAKITEISRVCVLRDKDRVFKVVVEIEDSDLRLKPGMTVSCEYICREEENALFVPNSCLLQENGKSYVFLRSGSSSGKTEVKAGPSNTHHTLILEGVTAGQSLVPLQEAINPKKL